MFKTVQYVANPACKISAINLIIAEILWFLMNIVENFTQNRLVCGKKYPNGMDFRKKSMVCSSSSECVEAAL